MPSKLTPIAIQNIKPRKARREIADGGARGLYLVVQPSGVKSWAVRYRHQGQSRKYTIGDADEISLAAARLAAAEAWVQIDQGHDPAAEKQRAKQTSVEHAQKLAQDTIDALVEKFLASHVNNPRRPLRPSTISMYTRIMNKIVVPAWSGRVIHDIDSDDVINLLEDVANERGGVIANRVQAALTKFFNWLIKPPRRVIAASPCTGVERVFEETERERVLDDNEVAQLWTALDDKGVTGAVVRLLMLTGCRHDEVRELPWSEIDFDTAIWTLPGARTKNKRTHLVPLSAQALALLQSLTRVHGSTLAFTLNGKTPVHLDRLKKQLNEQLKFTERWVWHDLRRTVATGLQKLGVRFEVNEAALNHKSGKVKGVARIYQRHDYAVEKRDALQRWADHVEGLVTGASGKVIKLRG